MNRMTLTIVEKVLIFKSRYGINSNKLARELEITSSYLSLVLTGKVKLSDGLAEKIEMMFRRYRFTEALDDKGRL
jgi:plasmid maintenance system antidote protein VapI